MYLISDRKDVCQGLDLGPSFSIRFWPVDICFLFDTIPHNNMIGSLLERVGIRVVEEEGIRPLFDEATEL